MPIVRPRPRLEQPIDERVEGKEPELGLSARNDGGAVRAPVPLQYDERRWIAQRQVIGIEEPLLYTR